VSHDKRPDLLRRWRFYVEVEDEEDCAYLDTTGAPVDPDDAVPWVGTMRDAHEEAERRADLWEEHDDGWPAGRVTSESLGIVEERGEGAR